MSFEPVRMRTTVLPSAAGALPTATAAAFCASPALACLSRAENTMPTTTPTSNSSASAGPRNFFIDGSPAGEASSGFRRPAAGRRVVVQATDRNAFAARIDRAYARQIDIFGFHPSAVSCSRTPAGCGMCGT